MRKVAIGSFLIIVFVTTTSTAYYDNTTGRWLQRDPVGVVPADVEGNWFDPLSQYSDTLNAYEYAESSPVVFSDPLGLSPTGIALCQLGIWPPNVGPCPRGVQQRSKEQCCSDAKKKGDDKGGGGGVVCCDGRKVACSWIPQPQNPNSGVQLAYRIIVECVEKHEKDHFDDVPDCPLKCPHLDRPFWTDPNTSSLQECSAYKVSTECLKKSRKKCEKVGLNRWDCYNIIDGRIAQEQAEMARLGCK